MVLPPDERAFLAQCLWDSLEDFAHPEIEQAWLEDSNKRWQEIEDGIVACIPAEEVMRKARSSLNK
jgi:putative addiction module component (TIGR02574 family)